MDNFWSTNFLLDSVALDAPKNDQETLIFSKMLKKQEKNMSLAGFEPGSSGTKVKCTAN